MKSNAFVTRFGVSCVTRMASIAMNRHAAVLAKNRNYLQPAARHVLAHTLQQHLDRILHSATRCDDDAEYKRCI